MNVKRSPNRTIHESRPYCISICCSGTCDVCQPNNLALQRMALTLYNCPMQSQSWNIHPSTLNLLLNRTGSRWIVSAKRGAQTWDTWTWTEEAHRGKTPPSMARAIHTGQTVGCLMAILGNPGLLSRLSLQSRPRMTMCVPQSLCSQKVGNLTSISSFPG